MTFKPLLATFLLTTAPFATAANLCQPGEETVFSFATKAGKLLSLCKGRGSTYLAYRFGKPGAVEFQFPDKLDATSWQRFEFSGLHRWGGKINAGFGDYSLAFATGGFRYTVYQGWSDEEDTYDIGVVVAGKGNPVRIDGRRKSQEGSLLLLNDERERLPNQAEQ